MRGQGAAGDVRHVAIDPIIRPMCRGSYHLRSPRNGPAALATKNAAVRGSRIGVVAHPAVVGAATLASA
jgi:hypothetical protein